MADIPLWLVRVNRQHWAASSRNKVGHGATISAALHALAAQFEGQVDVAVDVQDSPHEDSLNANADVSATAAAPAAKTGANARQVGGQHYKQRIEHWDWVAANALDYFQGQITKYVARWKLKDGIRDLEKAQHFMEKYMELASQEAAVAAETATEKEEKK